MKRRQFLTLLAGGLATPFVVTLNQASASSPVGQPFSTAASHINTSGLSSLSGRVFDLSVSSADPSPSGVVLWTHIAPAAYRSDAPLWFQVASDERFSNLVLEGKVDPDDIGPLRDYTVKVDLDGQLAAGQRYYYRFIYDATVSRTGRCRTAPADGAALSRLKLALLTCQDYTNGYYNALSHVAADDTLDFVLHLGDFIYETAGDPRFQSLPFADRAFVLPSGGLVAMDLNDYRMLYRTYRSDSQLQLAMERHTWIQVPDDHETANDAYWDYQRDTLGAPDHPYVTDAAYGNDPALLRQLKLDSQRAWLEYVPARVQVQESASHPHDFLKIYRRLRFGDFLDLFMIDSRSYRSSHPCGEKDVLGRYVPLGCSNLDAADRTMLGHAQRDWLIDGVTSSRARWKLVGNQTYMGRLALTLAGRSLAPLNVDAWDGYAHERGTIAAALQQNKVENFVVVTGDLHTYMSGYIKRDYGDVAPWHASNYLGVEFMTPSITSSTLIDSLAAKIGDDALRDKVVQGLAETAVILNNPHVKLFNSKDHGYSTLEFTRDYCEWIAYVVDKNSNSPTTARTCLARHRKYVGIPWLSVRSTKGY